MISRATSTGFRLFVILFLAATINPLAGCSTTKGRKTGSAAAGDEPLGAERTSYEELAAEYRRIRQASAERDTAYGELEDRIAKLQLRLLEKDTQIRELHERQASLQKKLDEAIQEVVRTKAKLRSLESRAEAASTMAEAEIALKTLRVQRADQPVDPEPTHAEHLLKMSAREFKNENYGGALYLASQAKSHINIARMRLSGRGQITAVEGEVLFAVPLPLQVNKPSNVREGPGLDFKVITTLKEGTPIIGYSYKGQWVRVQSELGVSGWIFQTLVSGR